MKKLISWTYYFTLLIFMPLIIIFQLFSWLKINYTELHIKYSQLFNQPSKFDISNLPSMGKLLYSGLESISTICLLLVLWYFLQLLKHYKTGHYFSKEGLTFLKKINVIVIFWAFYQLFFDTFASLLISCFKPAGQRFIDVSVSSHDVIHFFCIMLLLLLINIMQEGYKLKSEQDLVI